MQWTELEGYRQLLQEYEQRKAEYDKQLQQYRERVAASPESTQELESAKAVLDKEQTELEGMFERLKISRSNLARSRDATLAS